VVKGDTNVAGPKYVEENELHLKKLNTLAMQIRNNIVNPHTESRQYSSYTSTWMYGGQDWRLTVESWLMLMLPYLDDEKLWSKPISINYLYEHIKSSHFQRHYNELRDEIMKFKTEFYDAAEKIKVKNPEMFEEWETLNDDWISYISLHKPMNSPMPFDKIQPSEGDPQYFVEVLATFREYIADLDNRYDFLEDLLQQLYDDLDEIEIQDVIKKGMCEKCPV
jgi:acyl carrier protein phosphodiesterase